MARKIERAVQGEKLSWVRRNNFVRRLKGGEEGEERMEFGSLCYLHVCMCVCREWMCVHLDAVVLQRQIKCVICSA